MSDVALRPRSVTEILDATIQLFRNYFTTILAVGALAMVPWFVLQLVLSATVGYNPAMTVASAAGASPGQVMGQLIAAFGMWIGFALMSGAVIRVSADAYLGTEPNIGSAISATLRRLGTLILAGILKGFAIFLPVMAVGIMAAVLIPLAAGAGSSAGIAVVAFLLVIGALILALYLAARYVAVEAAVVLEGLGASAALTRSGQVTRGRVWPIAGALVVAFIIYVALLMGITTIAAVSGSSMLTMLITDAFIVLIYPLYAILAMLLYYDGRVRNEALDLEMMTKSLGVAPSAGAMSGAPTAP